MDEQLTIDGGAEPYELVAKRAAAHRELTDVQREILRSMRRDGGIRAVDAGVIVHAARRLANPGAYYTCGSGAKGSGKRRTGTCCPYAASDGYEAMKRLAARGLVKREDAKWVLS
jgi:hypothetical protein